MLPAHKTKIVCTIGPASADSSILEAMLEAGMNVARLNFSHGDFGGHEHTIRIIRAAARKTGRRVAILADLPGPKIRIGTLGEEPIELQPGQDFRLTVDDIVGDRTRVSVSLATLLEVVRPDDTLFLNDGLVQLRARSVEGADVVCKVVVGGELRSRKGLNLPGIRLGIGAFTEHDRACLEFALSQGVDAVSQSFVETAADVSAVREAARELGAAPFVIAKIERLGALDHLDEILAAADGIMVARGDLGVEIPIERIAVTQKRITGLANRLGKPVITATQMLMSMVEHRRPTRAEATDVANAILDGTDCVMLSEESAMGRWPVEAVRMLAGIAAATEPARSREALKLALEHYGKDGNIGVVDLIALSIQHAFERICPSAVVVPTRSGATARNVARFRLPVWITAFSATPDTCRQLQFSYGVHPVSVPEELEDWSDYTREWLEARGITEGLALLAQGPSAQNPHANHKMEILQLGGDAVPKPGQPPLSRQP
jgi:pyruvate kinase